jgi:acyl carrier protein
MTKDVIRDILVRELAVASNLIATETDLRTLGVDSIKILNVILKIERAFSVELDDKVTFGVRTVGELAEAVDRAKGDNGGNP